MTMSDVIYWCIILGSGALVLCIFDFGRKMLAAPFKGIWTLFEWLVKIFTKRIQGFILHTAKSHLIVMRNFAPRMTVLPTLDRKSVRRITREDGTN
jgi:hypothetical protein